MYPGLTRIQKSAVHLKYTTPEVCHRSLSHPRKV